MTACERGRELLLVADPDELAGVGDGPAAQHVRSCAHCSKAARAILDATEQLDRALDAAPRAGLDVDHILARARRRAEARPPRSMAPPRWSGWAGLAAAAVLVLVFSMRLLEPELPEPELRPIAMEPPLVEAAPSQNVAVIHTHNPDITVLWFYGG